MSDVAQLYPHVPLLKTPVQEPLPRADGTRIVWREPRRLLFRRIVKSDGSIVDFQRARITESIRAALSEVGHRTDHVEEVTDRVIIFLANRFDDRLLSTAEVALTVETTLLHSGLAEPAEVYAAQRRQRPLRVDGSDGTRWPWDRARIVSALRRETSLDFALAEEIARDVERTIIHARLDCVTASLVRELVNASLLERGLEEIRRKHTRLGLPVHDVLERITQEKSDRDVPREIGREVLSQLAMGQIFPVKAADLCRERLLYLHDTGAIHLPRSRRIHLAELTAGGETAETTARRIVAYRSNVAHHLTVICDSDSLNDRSSIDILRHLTHGLTFAPPPVVTEFEIPLTEENSCKVGAILNATCDAAQGYGALPLVFQVVLRTLDRSVVPLSIAGPCWSQGLLCVESGSCQSDRGGVIHSKFSLNLARLCATFECDVDRMIQEINEIFQLIAECAVAKVRAVDCSRQANQSLLWPEPVAPILVQLGLHGVERTAEWLGSTGWKRLAEAFRSRQARHPHMGVWIQLAEASGASARAWFGVDRVQSFSSLSASDRGGLFDSPGERDPWRDLGSIHRFHAVSERELSHDSLTYFARCEQALRWGYLPCLSWCSWCGRPIDNGMNSCPACTGSDVCSAARAGWFFREVSES